MQSWLAGIAQVDSSKRAPTALGKAAGRLAGWQLYLSAGPTASGRKGRSSVGSTHIVVAQQLCSHSSRAGLPWHICGSCPWAGAAGRSASGGRCCGRGKHASRAAAAGSILLLRQQLVEEKGILNQLLRHHTLSPLVGASGACSALGGCRQRCRCFRQLVRLQGHLQGVARHQQASCRHLLQVLLQQLLCQGQGGRAHILLLPWGLLWQLLRWLRGWVGRQGLFGLAPCRRLLLCAGVHLGGLILLLELLGGPSCMPRKCCRRTVAHTRCSMLDWRCLCCSTAAADVSCSSCGLQRSTRSGLVVHGSSQRRQAALDSCHLAFEAGNAGLPL